MAKLSSSNGKKANVPKLRFPEFSEEWKEISFSNLFDFLPNNTITRANLSNNGAIRNIHYGDVLIKFGSVLSIRSDDIPFIKNTDTVNNNVFLKNGDIVIADTAEDETVGKVTEIFDIYTEKVVSGLHTIPCRPKKNFAPKFLGYYMNSPAYHYQLFPLMQGVKVLSISKSNIVGTVIHYPDILQQTKITNLLSLIDKKISVQRQLVEALKKYKRGSLSALFPKKREITPQYRFAGFTKPWEQRKLGDCVEFLDTMRKPLKEGDREKGQYPYYGASGIVDYVSDYIFDEELVLLSEDGANITDRNYPVCFLASGKYWVNNHAHVLKTNKENENNFICNSLERMDFTPYNSGMAMPKLNKEVCQKIPLSCPSFAEQKEIGDYFRSLDTLITLHQHKYDILLSLKNALLQQMFI